MDVTKKKSPNIKNCSYQKNIKEILLRYMLFIHTRSSIKLPRLNKNCFVNKIKKDKHGEKRIFDWRIAKYNLENQKVLSINSKHLRSTRLTVLL